ncbi:hypothetical protein BT63DRAFT_473532 [Microthyrium microscopicum]|uniref:F-box domain-containing protein n=1 Tax=Microthyrium microscopicum TaxID=703497 RepID=A0A6A6U4I9_9PEZI|nr:hypothetical protein BT63DRAFT_473532 [Microthyrium microscopicum]
MPSAGQPVRQGTPTRFLEIGPTVIAQQHLLNGLIILYSRMSMPVQGLHALHQFERLRTAPVAGFTTIDNKDVTTYGIIPNCGWKQLSSVKTLGVRRGTFGIQNFTSKLPRGPPDDYQTVNSLLSESYPFVEITLIVSILLGPILLFFMLIPFTLAEGRVNRSHWARTDRRTLKEIRTSGKKETSKPRPQNPTSISPRKAPAFQPPNDYRLYLLGLPDELQLMIINYVDYENAIILRSTCKYYEGFITPKFLAEIRSSHNEEAIRWEQRPKLRQIEPEDPPHNVHTDSLYCSRCDLPRPTSTFQVSSHSWEPTIRVCLPCNYATGAYTQGFTTLASKLNTQYYRTAQKYFNFCGICQSCSDQAQTSVNAYHTCQTCSKSLRSVYEQPHSPALTCFIFEIIAWGLACTGNLPSHTWAWGSITGLFWLSLLHVFHVLVSGPNWNDPNYPVHKRLGFFYLVPVGSIVLCVSWLGVGAGMIYESAVLKPEGFYHYDSYSLATIFFCIAIGLLWWYGCWRQGKAYVHYRALKKAAPRVDKKALARMLIENHEVKTFMESDSMIVNV